MTFYFLSQPSKPSPTAEITLLPTQSPSPTAEIIWTPTATVETLTETIPTASRTPDTSPGPDFWRTMGDPDAPVVVEEFGDFQCPYCGRFHSRMEPKLRKEYIETGKVLFIYRNFIVIDSFVAGGKESRMAALGALCAGEQGKFWEYHDLLFENQSGENEGAFSVANLRSFALELELDADSFSQCLQEERYEEILTEDERLAYDYDLRGVPSLLINDELAEDIGGDAFFEAIDEALTET